MLPKSNLEATSVPDKLSNMLQGLNQNSKNRGVHRSKDEEIQKLIQEENVLQRIPFSDGNQLNIRSLSKVSAVSGSALGSALGSEEAVHTDSTQNNKIVSELQNYLQIRIQSDVEKVDEYEDSWPLLELRKSVNRIFKGFSEGSQILVTSKVFQVTVILVIIFNTIVLALEDPRATTLSSPYDSLELFFVYFYTVEFALVVAANGLILHPNSYLRDWWTILDLTILITAWLSAFAGSGFRLSSLRALRILRPLKSISSIKGMKALVFTLFNSIKPLVSALFILFFFIFIFSVAGLQLWMGALTNKCILISNGFYSPTGYCGADVCDEFYECGQALNNPNFGVTHFDNIFSALITVFQIITLEGWTVIMYITQIEFSYYSIFYYIPLIFIAANLLLNITLAIITISFHDASRQVFDKVNMYEHVTDSLFKAIYDNTMKYSQENAKSVHSAPAASEKQEEVLQVEDLEVEKVENKHRVRDKKKIVQATFKPLIHEEYDEGFKESDMFPEEGNFEAEEIIELNSIYERKLSGAVKIEPMISKITSGLKGKMNESQLSFGKDYLMAGKMETNQIVTDIQPDAEMLKKGRESYNQLKSVVTIKHQTLILLKNDPSSLKKSKLSLVEGFQVHSTSENDLIPVSDKPVYEGFQEFTYADPEAEDLLWSYYNSQKVKVREKFSEISSDFDLFYSLSLRSSKYKSFFEIVPSVKFFFQVLSSEMESNQGYWSGQAVDNNSSINHKVLTDQFSRMTFNIWTNGWIGVIEKCIYPIKSLVTNKQFNNLMLLGVLINTIALSIDHYEISEGLASDLQSINIFFTYFFLSELCLKIIGIGLKEFLRDYMNIFDAMVVTLSLIEIFILSSGSSTLSAFRGIRILRIFRVLRVVKLFRYLKFMSHIVSSIGKSISNLSYLFLLIALFQLIFTLLGMQIYGGTFNFPEGLPRGNFDSFHWAFVTTFQVLSIENWNDILTSSLRSTVGPWSCLLLVSWIILGNFILLNLFLAILLESFSEESDEELKILERRSNTKIQKKLMELDNFHDSDSEDQDDMFLSKYTVLDKIQCTKSFYVFSKNNIVRKWCYRISTSIQFEQFILIVIIINSLKLVWDTYILDYPSGSTEIVISNNFDMTLTIIFLIEFIVKSVAFGFFNDKESYLDDNWNKLDFIIVVFSVIDLSISNINIPIIKIFRLLRTLRPLKLIKHNPSMKIVVTALLESFSAILNVMIVIIVFKLIFAILGVSFLSGKMYKCSNPTIKTMDACKQSNYSWVNTNSNYDNVIEGMISLFIIMSQESWPNRMLEGVDSKGVGVSMETNSNPAIAYFYIIYLIVANFFFANLFTVVVFEKFNEAKTNESSLSALMLSKEKQLWIEIQKLIIKANPGIDLKTAPSNKFRNAMFRISKSKTFEITIMFFILLNMLVLSMPFQQASSEYLQALDTINLVCTFVFISEACIKIIGLGGLYFKDPWTLFDFSIVVTSCADIILTYTLTQSVPLLRQGPQIMRIVRVLRVSRLLRLVRSLDSIQRLVTIMTYALPAVLNVLGLLLLVFFIYAVLGAFLFHSVGPGLGITDYFNFNNFGNSMNILWRISTGEDYPSIMWDCVNQIDGRYYVIYFISFISIIDFVVLDLFISIILQSYEEFSGNPYNSVTLFAKDLKLFRKAWAKDNKYHDIRINKDKLIDLITNYGEKFEIMSSSSRISVIKLLGSMNVEMDNEGYFYFNDILHAVLKKKYAKLIKRNDKTALKIIRMEEYKAKIALRRLREKHIENRGLTDVQNLFFNSMLLKTVFKNWKGYANREDKDNSSITPRFSELEFPGENSLDCEQ